jgi:multimeric flavodoxin WrbA
MSGGKIVVLDGSASGDKELPRVLEVLYQALKADGGQIETLRLSEMKLAHCLGCFNCWVKTPGVCVEADAGREIARTIIRSDATVLFTPVTFGGYSPELKKMVDRLVQIASPFFQMDHGEIHHPPRYAHLPRLMVVGVQRHFNATEAHIFKTLAGRNAINLHPPSFATEVVHTSENEEALRGRFETLLTRSDSLPYGESAASLMPAPIELKASVRFTGVRRALLIVGSPKTNEASTSSALGSFLGECLKKRGWEMESLTLRASLNRPEGESELVEAVGRVGLILLVFPLYVDALPYLVTKALAVIGAHRRICGQPTPQRLMAIVNSGFPETLQNSIALAICREFAFQCGFTWAGGLAFGGGGMIGGEPLTKEKRPGPPVRNVLKALEITAECLAEGLPVPVEAANAIRRKYIPAALWNRLYVWMGAKSFEKVAAQNGISKDQLRAQPYAA